MAAIIQARDPPAAGDGGLDIAGEGFQLGPVDGETATLAHQGVRQRGAWSDSLSRVTDRLHHDANQFLGGQLVAPNGDGLGLPPLGVANRQVETLVAGRGQHNTPSMHYVPSKVKWNLGEVVYKLCAWPRNQRKGDPA